MGNTTEACTHMIELEAIADLLLMHVQCPIPKIKNKRKSVLAEEILHPAPNAVLQSNDNGKAELDSAGALEIHRAVSQNLVNDEGNMSAFSPLRAWKSGAQIVPVSHLGNSENVYNQDALFRQNGGVRLVLRTSPVIVSNPTSAVGTLCLVVLSGTCIPRESSTTQPYVRVCCDSGNGLKQVAITSETQDN